MQVVDHRKPNVRGWRGARGPGASRQPLKSSAELSTSHYAASDPVSAGARVVHAAAAPARGERGDSVVVRSTLGTPTGFEAALEQAVLECAPGRSLPRACDGVEEVLFVLGGRGVLHLGDGAHELEPESGAYLAPGERYELENPGPGPLRIVAVRIPDPAPPAGGGPARAVVRRLADQEAQDATTDREFRIVADPSCGLRSATHFVGCIPTKRAPEHFHTYDEVIYVLDGEGVLHTAEADEPVVAGSCIQLPARTVHCLENTGGDLMRVLAVFRPAGSPASAYYPDGTPAYAGTPPVEAS
jgi:mannose-6-phosphate isomerase-like protein (cupin superfamily)